ncbi:MAG: DUF58 domain-containing protein [Candidatus Bathyarchaeia archaeon]
MHSRIRLLHNACTGYTYVVLLVGAVLTPIPYSILAILLTALNAYASTRPRLKPSITFATILLTPMVFEETLPLQLNVLTSIPILQTLAEDLSENPPEELEASNGRRLTKRGKTLMYSSAILTALSTLLNHPSSAIGSTIAFTYISILMVLSIRRIPREPFETYRQTLRTLVGERAEATIRLNSRLKAPVNVRILHEEEWVSVKPSTFKVTPRTTVELKISVKPSLACPEALKLKLTAVDAWGLTTTCQDLEALELHVIPKAKYAEWIAKKYLEGSLRSMGYISTIQPGLKPSKSGVEFHGCRLYAPGDSPRNIEWKHTCKLQRLVVKEYSGGFGRPSVLAGNMTVRSREEADETLYSLISSAYTLARESTPTALAVYSRKDVLATTQPLNPEEALKRLLKLTGSVTVSKDVLRVLGPPQVERLSRLIDVLKSSESTTGLLSLLQLEYVALLNAARSHPAGRALKEASGRTPPPAMLIVVSNMTHDAEALAVRLRELKARGFEVIQPLEKRR